MGSFVRFCYLSNNPHGRPLRPHQLRDESVVVELYDQLRLSGLDYGGVFLNWNYPRGTKDTSLAEFAKLALTERDILLLTTRPPIDDEYGRKKPLMRSGSDLETAIFNVLRKECFRTCTRTHISLCDHLKGSMRTGFERRFNARFYSTGADAPYMERDPARKGFVRSAKSAGYLIHVPLGAGLPHLLAVFGMNGPMSLLWAYRLRAMPELGWALEEPSLLVAEISMTARIPEKPTTLRFCDPWKVEVAAKCRL
jgi:hypothetical protein